MGAWAEHCGKVLKLASKGCVGAFGDRVKGAGRWRRSAPEFDYAPIVGLAKKRRSAPEFGYAPTVLL